MYQQRANGILHSGERREFRLIFYSWQVSLHDALIFQPAWLSVLLDVHVIWQRTRLDVMLCRPGYPPCKASTMQAPSVNMVCWGHGKMWLLFSYNLRQGFWRGRGWRWSVCRDVGVVWLLNNVFMSSGRRPLFISGHRMRCSYVMSMHAAKIHHHTVNRLYSTLVLHGHTNDFIP